MTDKNQLRKELMMAETSIRTSVGDICNMLLNGNVADEQLVNNLLKTLVSCQEVALECRQIIEA